MENENIDKILDQKEQEAVVYNLNNVSQCWLCANRGEYLKWPFTEVIQTDYPALPVTDTFLVILPECKVSEKYMTSVYESSCKYFTYNPNWKETYPKKIEDEDTEDEQSREEEM